MPLARSSAVSASTAAARDRIRARNSSSELVFGASCSFAIVPRSAVSPANELAANFNHVWRNGDLPSSAGTTADPWCGGAHAAALRSAFPHQRSCRDSACDTAAARRRPPMPTIAMGANGGGQHVTDVPADASSDSLEDGLASPDSPMHGETSPWFGSETPSSPISPNDFPSLPTSACEADGPEISTPTGARGYRSRRAPGANPLRATLGGTRHYTAVDVPSRYARRACFAWVMAFSFAGCACRYGAGKWATHMGIAAHPYTGTRRDGDIEQARAVGDISRRDLGEISGAPRRRAPRRMAPSARRARLISRRSPRPPPTRRRRRPPPRYRRDRPRGAATPSAGGP